MSVAQWEREAIGERTRDALQHKIRQGERCGKVRFGHDLGPDGVRLIDNPAEQEGLILLRELAAEGRSLRSIARELTRHGIPTKEGRPRWDHSSVKRILARTA
jgi:site-specific DNA recombinase